jgi:hypothetical protein
MCKSMLRRLALESKIVKHWVHLFQSFKLWKSLRIFSSVNYQRTAVILTTAIQIHPLSASCQKFLQFAAAAWQVFFQQCLSMRRQH